MKALSIQDIEDTCTRYAVRYQQYGYSPKTLGWLKGKQDIRFEILTSQYNFANKSVLDLGCGFGDLNITLSKKNIPYTYLGIDLAKS